MPVDTDDALGGIVQAWDEIRHRRLACTGGTDQRDQLSGARAKGDSFQSDIPRLGGGFSFPVARRIVLVFLLPITFTCEREYRAHIFHAPVTFDILEQF